MAALAGLWSQVDPEAFDASYSAVLPQIEAMVYNGQLSAARRSQRAMDAFDSAWELPPQGIQVVPEAYAGVAADGYDIVNTLSLAPFYMKQAMTNTGDPEAAMRAGYAYTAAKAGNHINDAGRNADRVGLNARTYDGYIRICSPGACSRCIQLIGMSSSETAFLRHPQCRCKAAPVPEGGEIGAGIAESPREFFDNLTEAEQNRRFTKAGAEAIRLGADISRVVNARRGATGISYGQRDDFLRSPKWRRMQQVNIGTATNPIMVYQTHELTGQRAMRRYQYRDGIRLMPESIIRSTRSKELMRERLRHYGYIV